MSVFASRRARRGHYKAIAASVEFLRGVVGLDVREGQAPAGCFFPGVWCGGDHVLCYDPRVACVGDLLHDAGHLAVMPSRLRPLLGVGDVYGSPAMRTQPEELDPALWIGYFGDREPWPVLELNTVALEHAAIAWSYAAANAAGVDPRRVFGVTWYSPSNSGPVAGAGAELLRLLNYGTHPGIRELARLGLVDDADDFPFLRRWLAPD